MAFPTKKGVYVMEVLPCPSSSSQRISLEKTFLANEEEPNPWQRRAGVGEELLARWDGPP